MTSRWSRLPATRRSQSPTSLAFMPIASSLAALLHVISDQSVRDMTRELRRALEALKREVERLQGELHVVRQELEHRTRALPLPGCQSIQSIEALVGIE